jgi:ATP-dependent helicase/nuclease subunit B
MAQQPEPGSDPALLLAAGEAAFAPYLSHPDVRHFWWPRFKRMAQAFIHEDATLRADVGATVVELRGSLAFKINGVEHILTARADRIDRTARGPFRIIDYKTGEPPSASQVQVGLSPQLTLEAAILAQGKFGAEISGDVDDLVYVKASGGEPPVKIERLAGKLDPRALAAQHLARLKELLSAYRNTGQAYFPRTVVFKERDASPYDHLSRYDEWSRGGV